LRQSLGEPLFDDLFCDVAGVTVGDFSVHVGSPTRPKDDRSPVDDRHLKWLREVLPMFDTLKSLCVMTSSKATDKGLAHLADVPQLEQLDLDESRVTSAGLRHLTGAVGLKYLSLRSTSVGDDLASLRSFPQLVILDLGETAVTDAGLRHVAALPKLRTLL
jgi:hypothetical protein